MKILVVGDVVGENGVKKIKEVIQQLKQKEKIDFIIVNGENTAGGMGITEKLYKEILEIGANVVTMGNHTWGKKEIFNFINSPNLIRPANYPKEIPGKGYITLKCNDKKITIINLIGRTNMNVLSENPFIEVNQILNKIKQQTDIIIVDFHAEATAEKIAMGYYLDGKVNIVYGTHTHVQTSDETILPKGTAYITDIGMTGPKHSVIGMDIKASIKRFETTLPERYKLAEGECKFNGCIFDINDKDCRIHKITRINQ